MSERIIAEQTLRKINDMMTADQGASFRGWLQKVIPHIGDAYQQGHHPHRGHLGASMIGDECARALWYGFHWAAKPKFDGRMLRLFNRGHLEEARFIALLLMIGCQVYQQDEKGKQFRFSRAGGHFGGSCDGVVTGVPDLPEGMASLVEFKTHGEKSFIELKSKGVRAAKFEHYVQMNIYMRTMGLPVALYMAVNKNTDEIYAEIISLDSAVADQFLDRGDKIVWMAQEPRKLNESPGFWKCKFCGYRPICHQGAAPERNCRTCRHGCPDELSDGWCCDMHEELLDADKQLAACQDYERLF